MNRKQKTFLWIGIIAFVLMGLFPPWTLQFTSTSILTLSLDEKQWLAGQKSSTYKYLLTPPQLAYRTSALYRKIGVPFQIDVPKLGVQWAMVAVITGGLVLSLKDRKDT